MNGKTGFQKCILICTSVNRLIENFIEQKIDFEFFMETCFEAPAESKNIIYICAMTAYTGWPTFFNEFDSVCGHILVVGLCVIWFDFNIVIVLILLFLVFE